MRDARIGQVVRVKRGATIRRRGEGQRVERNRATGTVRQVWRGDRQALVQLDADALRYTVQLRDLRAVQQGAPPA